MAQDPRQARLLRDVNMTQFESDFVSCLEIQSNDIHVFTSCTPKVTITESFTKIYKPSILVGNGV